VPQAEEAWRHHLEQVAGSGRRPTISRPDKGPKDVPWLPDSLDPAPDLETLSKDTPVAVDVETTTKAPPWMPPRGELVSVAFSTCGIRWAYPACVRTPIQRVLGLPNPKLFHHAAFDLAWLVWSGFEIRGNIHDLLWASAMADGVGSRGLAHLSPYRYAVHYPQETPDLSLVLSYNGNDALATARIYRQAPDEVAAWRRHALYALYSRMAPRLARVSCFGIPLLQDRVTSLLDACNRQLRDAEARLWAVVREDVNRRSPQQLKRALGITGSTDEDALRQLGTPEALAVLDCRHLDGLLRSLEKWAGLDRLRGLITLNQAWTGRTASKQENLQNVPRALRIACGDPSCDWVSLDFASAELVVAAVITRCRRLLSWFADGRDPHTEAAALIFRKTIDAVTTRDRDAGKVANFNLLYGGGPTTIVKKAAERGVDLSLADAHAIVSKFFGLFPEIRAWQQHQEARMRRGEPITSPLGRTWQISATDWHGINQGLNAAIQATASDLTLLGLDRAWDRITAHGQVASLVHDSVEVIIPKGTFDPTAWREIARTIAGVDARFPMQIEVSAGPDWGSTVEQFTVSVHEGPSP
jgi:DNA polymerase I-like protein with 3'-5' exonuclease and polymerase domains